MRALAATVGGGHSAMRTLFVSPQVPWPLDVGSKIRIFNLLKSYAELGPVTLLCLSQEQSDAEAVQNLEPIVESIRCIALPDDGRSSVAGKWAALKQAVQRLPRIVQHFQCAPLAAEIETLLASREFDILHVQRLPMAENLSPWAHQQAAGQGLVRMLDLDDIESTKARRTFAMEPWFAPRKYLFWLQYVKLRLYERRTLPLFDVALVCSLTDQRQVVVRKCVNTVQVFSNGADISVGQNRASDDARTLVFFGAMNYQPNEDAALFFKESILPLIKQRVGDVRFVIAGKSPSERIRRLHNGRDLVVKGYVEDKDELFDLCTVFVVPIRVGGGTRIKILEAMAARKPVVSTSVGCEGIDVTPGSDILVGDSPAAFADACVELLNSSARRKDLGDAGWSLVGQKYRWEGIRDAFVSSVRGRWREGQGTQPGSVRRA